MHTHSHTSPHTTMNQLLTKLPNTHRMKCEQESPLSPLPAPHSPTQHPPTVPIHTTHPYHNTPLTHDKLTTLTGFPFFQFFPVAPFLSSMAASQFLARALFMAVSFWSIDCFAVLLFPERSRPPLPEYVNSSPLSTSSSYPPESTIEYAPSLSLPWIPATCGR